VRQCTPQPLFEELLSSVQVIWAPQPLNIKRKWMSKTGELNKRAKGAIKQQPGALIG
jgi:hypothetical protein